MDSYKSSSKYQKIRFFPLHKLPPTPLNSSFPLPNTFFSHTKTTNYPQSRFSFRTFNLYFQIKPPLSTLPKKHNHQCPNDERVGGITKSIISPYETAKVNSLHQHAAAHVLCVGPVDVDKVWIGNHETRFLLAVE